jgi:DNA-binding XRE family transcriptional regulator
VTVAGYQSVAQRNLTCAIRIRERRRQLGLTQAEVVDRVNGQGSRLSSQALSAIENGRRVAVGRLPDLAAALNCTVSYLLGLTADPDRWEPDDPDDPRPEPGPPGGHANGSPGGPANGSPGGHANGSPGGPAPAPRSWILGPDVPDIPSLLDPSRRP